MTDSSVKKVLECILPTVTLFAKKYKASVMNSNSQIDVRVISTKGIVTIQCFVSGKTPDQKLEILGLYRSGKESSKSKIAIPASVQDIDLSVVSDALAKTLS